jgi:aerobic carbon-monoxide dehydrogenase medium subunit
MTRSLAFVRPRTLDEAIAHLVEHDGDARVVAGSTALTIMLRQRLIDPAALVLLRGIDGLDAIARENGHIRLGALVTHRVRNQATVGGVLAEADYASDPPAVFVGLGAVIDAQGPAGTRTIPAGEFFRAFYETALEATEILTAVRVPIPPPQTVCVYQKYVSRSSEDRPCVGVFASAGPGGVRVVVGAAAETPQTFPEIEALGAAGLDASTIATIADRYAESIDTLDDMRGSAWYRTEMVRVWVGRALAEVARRSENA